MKEANEIKTWCHDNLKDYRKVLETVDKRIGKVKVPIEEEIPQQLNDLEKKLQSSLASSKQFNDDTEDFTRLLSRFEKTLGDQKPISADKDTNARQVKDHKYLVEEINLQKPKFDQLCKEGEELLNQAEHGDEKNTLEVKLNDIKKRWNDIKDKADQRQEILENIEKLAAQYDDDMCKMLPWLDGVENKCNPLECISVHSEALQKQQDIVKQLLDQFEKQRPIYEDLLNCSQPLSEKAEVDCEPVDKATANVKRRYEDLEKKLKVADKKTKDMKECVNKFDSKRKPVEELCAQVEQAVEEKPCYGDDLEKANNDIDKLKKQLDELQASKPRVDDVNKVGDELLAIEGKPDNVTAVKQSTDALSKQHDDLIDKLKEKIAESEKARESIKNFHDKLKDTKSTAEPLEKKVQDLQPLGSTPEKVKDQLVEVEDLQVELQCVNNLFNEAKMFGNEVLECNQNQPDVKKQIDENLQEAKKPLDELTGLLNTREEKLKDKLQECGALQDQIDDFIRRVKNIDDRVEELEKKPKSMKPSAMAVTMGVLENIKKDLSYEKPSYDKILNDGQKLLDSIESPSDKDALLAKLDDLKKLWNETNGKVNKEQVSEDDILKKAEDLDEKMNTLEHFLDDQEKKLRSLEPVGCSPEKLDQQQKEINVSSRNLMLFYSSNTYETLLVCSIQLKFLTFFTLFKE